MTRSALAYAAALSAAMLLGACSSSATGGSSHTTASSTSPAAHRVTTSLATAGPGTATVAASTPRTATRKATSLSGSWRGQYGGAFQGTFTLTWQQAGSTLTGSIHLSNPTDTLALHGTVHGSVISFGTVGSLGITYSGSATASSMSGHYSVQGGNRSAGGPWSASRS